MGGDVNNVDTDVVGAAATSRSLGWYGVEASCNDDAGDVAYRHSIDSVDDAWTARQLDTALEHADEEVVIVAGTSGSVTEDVAGSGDRSKEASSASLADELFGYLDCVC